MVTEINSVQINLAQQWLWWVSISMVNIYKIWNKRCPHKGKDTLFCITPLIIGMASEGKDIAQHRAIFANLEFYTAFS